jgi:hypothetical protein
MPDDTELMDLERGFWGGSEDFYRKHVADQCLLAFVQMAGVQSGEAVAQSTKGAARWTGLRIEPKGQLALGEDALVFTYEAWALREGNPYHALVSSAYVRQGGAWKLAFHQQTPMDGA